MNLAADVLITALFTAGMSMMAAEYLCFSLNAWAIYGGAAIVAAALFGLSFSRTSGWITLLMLIAAALVACICGWQPIDVIREIMHAVQRGEGLNAYIDTIALFFMVLLFVMCYIIVQVPYSGSVLSFVAVGMMGIFWFYGDFSTTVHILPVLAALSAMYVKGGKVKNRLLTLLTYSLISAVIACAVIPGSGYKSETLERYATKTLSAILKTLNIEKNNLDERRTFTIASNGWMYRRDTFGGPANPSTDELMKVKSEETAYLRGAIRYVYNTRAWVDEDNESRAGKIKRYMMGGLEGLIYQDEYEKAFDLDKPAAQKYFTEQNISVEILLDSDFWSIYSPARTQSVTLDADANAYYNNVGEMFASRPLKAGDSYTLTALMPGDQNVKEAVEACAGEKDRAFAGVALLYRDVPAGVEQALKERTFMIIEGCETPYDKACAICDWLKNNGEYSLYAEYLPEGHDMVSWFVLDEMKGYCALYASSMALMARIAGLASRYVEG